MHVPFFIIICFGLPLLLYGFYLFDRLVKTEHAQNPAAWEADGKPNGFFWRAPERTMFGSDLARTRASMSWVFVTPEWIKDLPDSIVLLRRFRFCILGWNILVIVVFLMMGLNSQ